MTVVAAFIRIEDAEAFIADVNDGSGAEELELFIDGERRPVATRPGDHAALYAAETGVSYSRALIACNMD